MVGFKKWHSEAAPWFIWLRIPELGFAISLAFHWRNDVV